MNAQLEATNGLISISSRAPSVRPLAPAEQWSANSDQGVVLSVDTEPSDELAAAPVIAIDFPAFTDGRGLSLGVLLRTRFGFAGELRAVGDINADLLHYLARCGFDSVELKNPSVNADGTNVLTGFNSLAPYSDNYQASVVEPEPAYRRVRRGC